MVLHLQKPVVHSLPVWLATLSLDAGVVDVISAIDSARWDQLLELKDRQEVSLSEHGRWDLIGLSGDEATLTHVGEGLASDDREEGWEKFKTCMMAKNATTKAKFEQIVAEQWPERSKKKREFLNAAKDFGWKDAPAFKTGLNQCLRHVEWVCFVKCLNDRWNDSKCSSTSDVWGEMDWNTRTDSVQQIDTGDAELREAKTKWDANKYLKAWALDYCLPAQPKFQPKDATNYWYTPATMKPEKTLSNLKWIDWPAKPAKEKLCPNQQSPPAPDWDLIGGIIGAVAAVAVALGIGLGIGLDKESRKDAKVDPAKQPTVTIPVTNPKAKSGKNPKATNPTPKATNPTPTNPATQPPVVAEKSKKSKPKEKSKRSVPAKPTPTRKTPTLKAGSKEPQKEEDESVPVAVWVGLGVAGLALGLLFRFRKRLPFGRARKRKLRARAMSDPSPKLDVEEMGDSSRTPQDGPQEKPRDISPEQPAGPGASTPEASAPEASAPEASAPEASAPEAFGPEVLQRGKTQSWVPQKKVKAWSAARNFFEEAVAANRVFVPTSHRGGDYGRQVQSERYWREGDDFIPREVAATEVDTVPRRVNSEVSAGGRKLPMMPLLPAETQPLPAETPPPHVAAFEEPAETSPKPAAPKPPDVIDVMPSSKKFERKKTVRGPVRNIKLFDDSDDDT